MGIPREPRKTAVLCSDDETFTDEHNVFDKDKRKNIYLYSVLVYTLCCLCVVYFRT